MQHDEGSKTQTITAYDAMYFLAQNAAVSKTIENAAKFYDPQTLMDIITNFTGIELEDENCLLWTANLMLDSNGKRISNGKNVSISLKYEEIKDLTVRDIIAKIALLTGTNAIFNRNNKLEFLSLKNRYAPKNQNVIYTEYDPYIGEWKSYEKIVSDEIEIDAKKRYYTFSKDDTDSQIVEGFVEYGNYTASTRQIASYPYGTGVIDLTFTISDTSIGNTDAATEIMKSFYYRNMEQLHDYMPGSVSFIGDPSLRVGDIVSVIDLDGKNHKFPIMQNTIEYDGGVKNTCYAYGKGDSDSDSYYTESSSGSTVSSINSAPYTPPDIQKINEKISSIEKELDKKQDTLTFDTIPTQNSANPVTSDGVYTAIARSRANITAVSVDMSIIPDMWQDGTVTITSSEIHAESIVTVGLQLGTATTDLVQAVGSALIVAKSQKEGTIVLECLGKVPAVTIPITLTILTDTSYAVIQTIDFMVLPSDWVAGAMTLTNANFMSDSIVDIGLQVGAATENIAKAAANATIAAQAQTNGAITLVCFGTVPSIVLPLSVTVINAGGSMA